MALDADKLNTRVLLSDVVGASCFCGLAKNASSYRRILHNEEHNGSGVTTSDTTHQKTSSRTLQQNAE